MANDEWTATWDWAKATWGPDEHYGFHWFFRGLASLRAQREGWEELGSSDVWHATYYAVQQARAAGVKTRSDLVRHMMDQMG